MSEFVEIKTADLVGAALDWAVAQVEGIEYLHAGIKCRTRLTARIFHHYTKPNFMPSTDWSQGGPLIETEELTVEPSAWDWKGACVLWRAQEEGANVYFEHTNLLVAAMRAVVHAKLGDTVSVPKELV